LDDSFQAGIKKKDSWEYSIIGNIRSMKKQLILAAIMSTHISGYSALMSEDEKQALPMC